MSDVIPDQPPTGGGGGSGSVTSVSVTTANGVSGSVANATTTPALTLTLGDIVPTSLGVGTGATTLATVFQVASSLTTSPRGILSSQHNDGTDSAHLHMRKSRGTLAAPTVIVTGDLIGRVVFAGYDGSNYLEMGGILCTSTGTIASTRVPTKMDFYTATDAAPSVLTSRMNIGPSGAVTMSANITSSSATTGTLVVTGGLGVSGATYIGGGLTATGQIVSSNSVFASGYVQLNSSGRLVFTSQGELAGVSDGIFKLLDSAQTGFGRLQFGGTTNSYNAIARDAVNGFTIQSAAGTATYNDASTANSGTVAIRYLLGLALPTLSSTGTSVTYSDAATIYIGGAPAAGTNVTIARPWSLWVDAGAVRFDGTLQLGNAAVTGLTAGVLAATTNASITLTDSTGQLYRIPCII